MRSVCMTCVYVQHPVHAFLTPPSRTSYLMHAPCAACVRPAGCIRVAATHAGATRSRRPPATGSGAEADVASARATPAFEKAVPRATPSARQGGRPAPGAAGCTSSVLVCPVEVWDPTKRPSYASVFSQKPSNFPKPTNAGSYVVNATNVINPVFSVGGAHLVCRGSRRDLVNPREQKMVVDFILNKTGESRYVGGRQCCSAVPGDLSARTGTAWSSCPPRRSPRGSRAPCSACSTGGGR